MTNLSILRLKRCGKAHLNHLNNHNTVATLIILVSFFKSLYVNSRSVSAITPYNCQKIGLLSLDDL